MKKHYLFYLALLALPFSACEKGEIGPQGEQGVKGATGVQGAKGDKGDTGTNGTNGTNGADGATGAQGAAGTKGDTGATGAAGAQGPAGQTVYVGTNGVIGPKGDTGATGATGAQGPKGDTGATGATGAAGSDAASGAFSTTYLNTKFNSTTINLLYTSDAVDANGNPGNYIKLQSVLTLTPANYATIAEKGLVLVYVRNTTDSEGIWKLQSSDDILFNESGGITTDAINNIAVLNFDAYAAKSYIKITATIQGILNRNNMENLLRNTGVDIKVVMVPERTASTIKAKGLNLKNFSAVAQSLNIH